MPLLKPSSFFKNRRRTSQDRWCTSKWNLGINETLEVLNNPLFNPFSGNIAQEFLKEKWTADDAEKFLTTMVKDKDQYRGSTDFFSTVVELYFYKEPDKAIVFLDRLILDHGGDSRKKDLIQSCIRVREGAVKKNKLKTLNKIPKDVQKMIAEVMKTSVLDGTKDKKEDERQCDAEILDLRLKFRDKINLHADLNIIYAEDPESESPSPRTKRAAELIFVEERDQAKKRTNLMDAATLSPRTTIDLLPKYCTSKHAADTLIQALYQWDNKEYFFLKMNEYFDSIQSGELHKDASALYEVCCKVASQVDSEGAYIIIADSKNLFPKISRPYLEELKEKGDLPERDTQSKTEAQLKLHAKQKAESTLRNADLYTREDLLKAARLSPRTALNFEILDLYRRKAYSFEIMKMAHDNPPKRTRLDHANYYETWANMVFRNLSDYKREDILQAALIDPANALSSLAVLTDQSLCKEVAQVAFSLFSLNGYPIWMHEKELALLIKYADLAEEDLMILAKEKPYLMKKTECISTYCTKTYALKIVQMACGPEQSVRENSPEKLLSQARLLNPDFFDINFKELLKTIIDVKPASFPLRDVIAKRKADLNRANWFTLIQIDPSIIVDPEIRPFVEAKPYGNKLIEEALKSINNREKRARDRRYGR